MAHSTRINFASQGFGFFQIELLILKYYTKFDLNRLKMASMWDCIIYSSLVLKMYDNVEVTFSSSFIDTTCETELLSMYA